MFQSFFGRIWNEAYALNDTNILTLLERNPAATVLDIGCGDGQKTIKFKKKIESPEITGIDGVYQRLKVARERGVNNVKRINLEKAWTLSSNHYDVIISNQVIEHIVDTDNFISEIKRILKPNGYIIISTENLASWHNICALILGYQDFSHHLIKKVHVSNPLSLHYGEKTVAWSAAGNSGVDDTAFPHTKIPTFRSLIKIFEAYGFRFEKGYGAGYYPLFGSLGLLASRIDPYHSHFISIKFRKQ